MEAYDQNNFRYARKSTSECSTAGFKNNDGPKRKQ